MNNNPIIYDDPTGHCIGLPSCMVELTKAGYLLIKRLMDNGKLIDSDFIDAADFAAPAVSSGSKESISLAGSLMVTGVISKTLITTDDGQVQIFNEEGYGGGLPGATLSITHGPVYKLDNAIDYEAGATQGNIGVPLANVGGIAIEGYIADGGNRKDPVWGGDFGAYFGIGPQILGAAHTNAVPTDNAGGRIPRQLKSHELLVCRLLSMCGAQ